MSARRGRLALIVFLVLAFCWGTAIAAAYEALEDLKAWGVMDGTW
jgi:hypothetical protein